MPFLARLEALGLSKLRDSLHREVQHVERSVWFAGLWYNVHSGWYVDQVPWEA